MAVGQVRRHQALITRFRPTAPWLLLDCAVSKPSVNQCVDRAQDLPRLESLAFSREETRQAFITARGSKDFASVFTAISMPCRKLASASQTYIATR